MKEPFDFDPTLLRELITRRWREDRAYYSLRHAEPGWLKALWSQRTDHGGVEVHCVRRAGLHQPVALASSSG